MEGFGSVNGKMSEHVFTQSEKKRGPDQYSCVAAVAHIAVSALLPGIYILRQEGITLYLVRYTIAVASRSFSIFFITAIWPKW